MRQPQIIDYLRDEVLTVRETNGWRERGSATFDPDGSVNHHTAGSPSGSAPSLLYVINNVLCNAFQSREQDARGFDVIYLVAAGRANHAGVGSWLGVAGNTRFWGLEVEHAGTLAEPFPSSRAETSARVHAAFAKCSGFDPSMVCQHHEYAEPEGRKRDFLAALLDPGWLRNRTSAIIQGTPTIQEDDDVAVIPSWAKPLSGRWPHFALVDRTDTRAVVTATPGAPFAAGLDKIASPRFVYGSAFGLSTLTITGLGSAPRGIAEAPDGQVALVCSDGATFGIAAKPAAG